MKTDLKEIQDTFKTFLREQTPPLQIRVDKETNFEAAGTKEAMQGKQKVSGYYFASIVPKPKDVRFYFFPIYTHVKAFENISEEMRKTLKGKSCFHIKKLSPELEEEFRQLIQTGVELYLKDELI